MTDMGTANSTPPGRLSELASLTPLITALVAGYGGFKLFEPKLERLRSMRAVNGEFEPSFSWLYRYPQFILIAASMAVVLFLLVAFIHSFQPTVLPQFIPESLLDAAISSDNIVWIILCVGTLGLMIYWNVLSYILLGLTWAASLLPIPGLQGRFGPRGNSVGWHQTAVVSQGPDKGAPLMIDPAAVDRVAWGILSRLSSNSGSQDYAGPPAGLDAVVRANILLFGCIMEQNYYAHRWATPKEWSKFYAALSDLQVSEPTFSQQEILSFPNGPAFFEAFRDRLGRALTKQGLSVPPDRGLAAAADISKAWELLKQRGNGSVLGLVPWIGRYLGGPTAWLDLRLRTFPRLSSDGMRPQLIKLLTRWNTLPKIGSVFMQPFAKRQAWLLLQMGALRALPELKEVSFLGDGQVAISRIAALRVIRRVSALIEEGASSEAVAVAARLGPDEWTRLESADFVLWSWAREMAATAASEEWKKTAWSWKFEDDRVQRVG